MSAGGFAFVVGGARSGKSRHALCLASTHEGAEKVYVATALSLDSEMSARIEAHRGERGEEWATVEEPVDVVGVVGGAGPGKVMVIDCLTLWLTNLIHAGLNDGKIKEDISALAQACMASPSAVIAVSNEVGLGLVPDNALARRFRDLSGWMNQEMALNATEAWFVASGIPLRLK